jgi:Amiloride-sensitive sodium channel
LDDPLPWNISHIQTALRIYPYKIYPGWNTVGRPRYKYSNPFQPFDGYRVVVHNNDEFSSYSGRQFIHVQEHFTDVEIKPEVHLIDESVRKMSIVKRNCYLSHEKSLKFFKIYTKKNCEQECLSSMMRNECGCVAFFVISKRRLELIHMLSDSF